MNVLFLLALCIAVSADEYMTDPVDPYNVDTLPNHPEVVKARVNCLLDKEPCDEVSSQYKVLQYDLVRQECGHCSPHLKHFYNVFLKAVKTHWPMEYKDYRKKYDPDGLHFEALEAALANF